MTTLRPAQVEYHRASSVEDALQALGSRPEAKVLAGGHSLIPAMNLRLAAPALLVDIGRIGSLKGVQANGTLKIGALTTHAMVASSDQVKAYAPALANAASHIGDPQVRNWGTLGGNIAHADPASDPPAVLLAYGATIHLQGPAGARQVAADDFFKGLFETAVQPDELVTAVEIANHQGSKSAYAKLMHPASRYALVGVAVNLKVEGGTCTDARVAVGGATSHAVRSPAAEAALKGSGLDAAAQDTAANALMQELADAILGDIYAPVDYRRAMTGAYLKRAIKAALS